MIRSERDFMLTTIARSVFTLAIAFTPAFAAAQPQTPAEQPVIVTQGEATIKRAPDRAWLTVAAEARAAKPADAQRAAANAMTATQQAIMSRGGLGGDQIKTTSYSLQPDIEYTGGASRVRGYIARNEIEVRVDALEKLGDILDAAGSSGATSIAGLRFDLKDRDTVERDALRQAVRNAMGRAEAMASGANRSLGPIVRIEEQGGGVVTPVPYQTMMRVEGGQAGTPITPGQVDVRVHVTLTVSIR
jgi:uncharacterized protein YggE